MTDQAPTIVRDKRGRLPAGSPPLIQPREEVAPNPKSAPKRRYWKPGDIAIATAEARRQTKNSPLSRKEILATTPAAIQPLTVSVQEARLALGIGNSLMWRLIGAGKLQTILLGAKRFVTVASMERLIAEQLAKEIEP
jgi:hypothetical protein